MQLVKKQGNITRQKRWGEFSRLKMLNLKLKRPGEIPQIKMFKLNLKKKQYFDLRDFSMYLELKAYLAIRFKVKVAWHALKIVFVVTREFSTSFGPGYVALSYIYFIMN